MVALGRINTALVPGGLRTTGTHLKVAQSRVLAQNANNQMMQVRLQCLFALGGQACRSAQTKLVPCV